MLKKSLFLIGVALLVLSTTLVFGTDEATAQSNERTTVDLVAPTSVTVGDEAELNATVLVGGSPVSGATVKFVRFAKFMNAGSDILIGSTVTDSNGVANIGFIPRSEGEILVTAEVVPSDDVRIAITEATIEVGTGPALYTQEAGISIPGLTVAWLVAILGAIWMTFMFVLILVWRIARAGTAFEVAGGESGE